MPFGCDHAVDPLANGRVTFARTFFEALAVEDFILPRAYLIKPDFCNVCAHNDTDVLLTPSMCDRNSWVRGTCSEPSTSCEIKSQRQKRA